MGRKGGLASIFSSSKSKHLGAAAAAAPSSSPPWPWPSCATKPQTASFRRQGGGGEDERRPCSTAAGARLRPPRRAAGADDVMFKTVNSVYFDDGSCRSLFDDCCAREEDAAEVGVGDGSFSTTAAASEEWSEAVIRSLGRTSTDRFFFDAGPAAPASSNSILASSLSSPSPGCSRTTPLLAVAPAGEAEESSSSWDDHLGSASSEAEEDESVEEPPPSLVMEESVAVALESEDPFRDFRASMVEMVAAHGLRDWAELQEMLLWYLRINGKRNHALIVGAFVGLLVGLATNTSRSTNITAVCSLIHFQQTCVFSSSSRQQQRQEYRRWQWQAYFLGMCFQMADMI